MLRTSVAKLRELLSSPSLRRVDRRGSVDYQDARFQSDGTDDYLQWWYFDGDFRSGHRLMVIFLPRNFGRVHGRGNAAEPTVTMTITDPTGRNLQSQRFHLDDFDADPSRMHVRFGGSSIEYGQGQYRMVIDQDGLGCDLVYRPTVSPWAPLPGGDGYMAKALLRAAQRGGSSNDFFHYASMMPRAAIEGRLCLDGQSIEVEGNGYHEQGRTNVGLPTVFESWYWTRFFVDDWTFIFVTSRAPRHALNAKMRALLVCRGGEVLYDIFDISGLSLGHRVHQTQTHAPSGRELPLKATCWGRRPGFRLTMDMHLEQERTSFCYDYLRQTTPLQPAWMQHFMHVDVKLTHDGRDYAFCGEGVFESMLSGAK